MLVLIFICCVQDYNCVKINVHLAQSYLWSADSVKLEHKGKEKLDQYYSRLYYFHVQIFILRSFNKYSLLTSKMCQAQKMLTIRVRISTGQG